MGADAILAPAADFRAVHPMHGHMSVFRSIENGVSLVRQADNGLSLVTDPYGRVLASMDHFAGGERVVVAQMPTRGVATPYAFWGDVFAWGTVAAGTGFFGLARFRGRRAGAALASPRATRLS